MKKTTIYRKPMQKGVFEEEYTLGTLSAMGNPLEQVSALVDFEMFRPTFESNIQQKKVKQHPRKMNNLHYLCKRNDGGIFYGRGIIAITIRFGGSQKQHPQGAQTYAFSNLF